MPARTARAGGFERESENATRFERVDDRIAVSAGGGMPRIEPAFVVGARLVDTVLQIGRDGLARGFQLVQFGAEHRLDGRVAFHDADASRGPGEREVRVETL